MPEIVDAAIAVLAVVAAGATTVFYWLAARHKDRIIAEQARAIENLQRRLRGHEAVWEQVLPARTGFMNSGVGDDYGD